MRRFVILRHDWPFLHWDFLVEEGDALLAWRLLSEPLTKKEITAESLPAHRLVYLDYEGPVSGGRGSVSCWDRGIVVSFRKNRCDYDLQIEGTRLSGQVLVRSEETESSEMRTCIFFESKTSSP